MTKSTLIFLLLLATPAAAHACMASIEDKEKLIAQYDTNHDFSLDLAEYAAFVNDDTEGFLWPAEEIFIRLDANHDQKLSAAEFDPWQGKKDRLQCM
jgi:hypothetical protein